MKSLGRLFFIFVGILQSINLFAQTDSVTMQLSKRGIDISCIEQSFHTDDSVHYFKISINAISPKANNLTLIEYNPQRDIKECWKMLSFNGNPVSENWQQDYTKEVNKKRGAIIGIRFNGIVIENDSTIIVSFKCQKANLPDRYKDLERCTGLAYINTVTKHIDKEIFTTTVPFRLQNLDINTYKMQRNFSYNEEEKYNQLIADDIEMSLNYKGKLSTAIVTYIYFDYKKVK